MVQAFSNWFSPLWQNLLQLFSPVTSFFSSVFGYVVKIVGFIWDVIEFIGYGIGTALSYIWDVLSHIFGLSSWYYLFHDIFGGLAVFLGVDIIYFVLLFFVAFILIIFSFLTRLIFGKLHFIDRK